MSSPISFSSAMPPRPINSVSVETATGSKTFELVLGNVATVPTNLLVVSTHSNLDFGASGLVIDSLRDIYDIHVNRDQRWLTLGADLWTCFQPQDAPIPFSGLLTICLPQILHQPDPLPFFDKAMRGVFASCAALEYMGEAYPVISLPVLYGQRLVPKHYPAAVQSMIRHAIHWLKQSERTETIKFVIFEEEKKEKIDAWNEAMDECLGRSLIAAGMDGVIKSLCQEIRQQATAQPDSRLQNAVKPLASALAHSDRPDVQSVCVFGRKLVEEMLQVLMPLWGLKMQKELMNNIETLRIAGRVAPWITSYMHSLRVFGNEEVHAKAQSPNYRPPHMDKGDLVSALCAIRALLSSWPEIQKGSKNGNGAADNKA